MVTLLAGCSTVEHRGRTARAVASAERELPGPFVPSRELEDRILALDPENVSPQEITEVLARAPAPRVINIHGGVLPIKYTMHSFAEFLVGMGYPRASIRIPVEGTYTFGYYESGRDLAGMVAWYYEREGLRPMLVGHSLGGIRALEVLHHLAGDVGDLTVFNPLTWRAEPRREIVDPLTGAKRPVVGVEASFVAAVAAGGLGRLVPGEWDMWEKLRQVPDSVAEFTGYYIGFDPLGGDNLGFGPANHYRASGAAVVRNVRLPDDYRHLMCPDTEHLVRDQSIRDWINSYQPSDEPKLEVKFKANSRNILFAADVWRSIKRHWVLELQRWVRARRARANDGQPLGYSPAGGAAARSAGRHVLPSVNRSSN